MKDATDIEKGENIKKWAENLIYRLKHGRDTKNQQRYQFQTKNQNNPTVQDFVQDQLRK